MPKKLLTDLVLESIDLISSRKNRPNLLRIYRHLNRIYDLSLPTCEALLQSLLKEGRVVRVTYKGNISYRNAEKWKKYSCYMKKNSASPELSGALLTHAISELIVQEPDYLQMGVPCCVLENHLLSQEDENITKEAIHKLLQRELKYESLLQLDNGNYFLGPKPCQSPFGSENGSPDAAKRKMEHKFDASNSSANTNFLSPSDSEETDNSLIKLEETNTVQLQASQEIDESEVLEVEEEERKIIVKKELKAVDDNNIHGFIRIQDAPHFGIKPFNISNFRQSNGNPESNEECKTERIKVKNNEFLLEKKASELTTLRTLLDDDSSSSSLSSHIDNDKRKLNDQEAFNMNQCENKKRKIDLDHNGHSEFQQSSSEVIYKKNYKKDSNPYSLNVHERAQRKKIKKYDSSDYYFPSLTKKKKEVGSATSSTDSENKDEKRKKKKKKKVRGIGSVGDDGGFSGMFAEKVVFPGNGCSECHSSLYKTPAEVVVTCSTCTNQGHHTCAQKTTKGSKNWYCKGCRTDALTCVVCAEVSREQQTNQLISCVQCGDGYHRDCLEPPLVGSVPNKWVCSSCTSRPGPPPYQRKDPVKSSPKKIKVNRTYKMLPEWMGNKKEFKCKENNKSNDKEKAEENVEKKNDNSPRKIEEIKEAEDVKQTVQREFHREVVKVKNLEDLMEAETPQENSVVVVEVENPMLPYEDQEIGETVQAEVQVEEEDGNNSPVQRRIVIEVRGDLGSQENESMEEVEMNERSQSEGNVEKGEDVTKTEDEMQDKKEEQVNTKTEDEVQDKKEEQVNTKAEDEVQDKKEEQVYTKTEDEVQDKKEEQVNTKKDDEVQDKKEEQVNMDESKTPEEVAKESSEGMEAEENKNSEEGIEINESEQTNEEAPSKQENHTGDGNKVIEDCSMTAEIRIKEELTEEESFVEEGGHNRMEIECQEGEENLNEEMEEIEEQEMVRLEREKETSPLLQRHPCILEDEPPDPTSWTTKDVYLYFCQYFDDNVARTILEEDIDGYALKLMGRSDVLRLGFKLGIGLKVLFHVRRLQLRTNNLHDIWGD